MRSVSHGPPPNTVDNKEMIALCERWNALQRTYPPKHGEPGHVCRNTLAIMEQRLRKAAADILQEELAIMAKGRG